MKRSGQGGDPARVRRERRKTAEAGLRQIADVINES
jgi:hypothetical protein